MTAARRPVIANIDRLNRFMDENRLRAVVARSGTNFTYLSRLAYPGTLAQHLDLPDSPRGVYLVWPRAWGWLLVAIATITMPRLERAV